MTEANATAARRETLLPQQDAPLAEPEPRRLLTRFLGYLTADSLNYLLGFAIYGWLIRLLSNTEYGHLSVATSVYQVLMMLAALGLDLVGPRLIQDAGGDSSELARLGQRARMKVVFAVCLPITLLVAFVYWHRGQGDVAGIILAGFSMVVARALDVSYLAVALGTPGALAKTRALGLGLYLVVLFAASPVVARFVWIVPILNAVGVTIGRVQLMRLLRSHAGERIRQTRQTVTERTIALRGAKAGLGQLLLFALQSLDVVLLSRFAPAEAVGQYSMVSRLYLFATAVLAALLNAYVPELVAVATRRMSLSRLFRRFLLVSTALGVAGALLFWLLAPRLCELLGHRHLPVVLRVAPVYALIFLVIAIGNPFLSFLPSLHRSTSYTVGIAGALLLLLGLDLQLMPRYGAIGAAWGQLAATVFLALFMAGSYLHYLRSLPNEIATANAEARA